MKITFSSTHSAFSVKAPAGTLVSLTGTPATATDGVYTVGDDGYILIDEGILSDSIYLDTTGEDYAVTLGARVCYPAEGVEVRAGASVLPFKGKAKGGDGGGTFGVEDVVLWENEEISRPNTITLPQSVQNFDEVMIVLFDSGKQSGTSFTRQRHVITNLMDSALVGTPTDWTTGTLFEYYDPSNHIVYQLVSTTSMVIRINSPVQEGYYPKYVIGRRYTRVNPTGYRETVLWENETETVYPQTITLSDSFFNVDKIVINTLEYNGGTTYVHEATAHPALYSVGNVATLFFIDASNWASYIITNATTLTLKASAGRTYKIASIIGIKY